MKVTVCTTVDVEAEVDVTLNDCINEWFSTLDMEFETVDGPEPRKALPIVDGATKVLAAVPDSVIMAANADARTEVVYRLERLLERWRMGLK